MDALAHEATVTTTLRWTGRGEGDESEGRQIGIRRVGRDSRRPKLTRGRPLLDRRGIAAPARQSGRKYQARLWSFTAAGHSKASPRSPSNEP